MRRTHASAALRSRLVVAALLVPIGGVVTLPELVPVQAQGAGTAGAQQDFLFAYRLLEQRQYELAAEAFDRYLTTYPRDERVGDARYYRALIHRRQQAYDQAIRTLENAPSPTLLDRWRVSLLLGQLYLDTGRAADARGVLGSIDEEGLNDEAIATIRYHLARAFAESGQPDAAAQYYLEAAEPETEIRPRALIELASNRLSAGLEDDAEAALNRAIATQDATIAPIAARMAGDLARRRNQLAQAIQAYTHLLTTYPDSDQASPAALGVIASYAAQGDQRAVVESFVQFRDQVEQAERPSAAYLAGSAMVSMGRNQDAVNTLTPIRDQDHSYPPGDRVLYLLVLSYSRLEQYEALDTAVEQLMSRYPSSARVFDAQFISAVSQSKRGNDQAALAGFSRIVQRVDQPYRLQALLQRAGVYERLEQPQEALNDYDAYFQAVTIADRTPNDMQASAMLRYLQLGHQLRQFELVRDTARQWSQTMTLSDEVRQELLYRLGLSALIAQDYATAGEALSTLDQDFPEHPHTATTQYYRGRLAIVGGETERGIEMVRQAQKREDLPQSLKIEALRLQQAYHLQNGDADLAAAVMQELENIASLDVLSDADLIWLGRRALAQGEPDGALSYLEPVRDPSMRPNVDPERRARALFLSGIAYRRLDQPNDAVALFQAVIQLNAGFGLEANLELAGCFTEIDQTEQALALYPRLINTASSQVNTRALYEYGQLLETQGQTEQARAQFLRLTLLFGQAQHATYYPYPHQAYLELAALEQQTNGDPTPHWQKVVETYPDSMQSTFARAALQAAEGDREAALQTLSTLQIDDPGQPQAEAELAQRVARLQEQLNGS